MAEQKLHEDALEGLREHSVIVADTAEYNVIAQYKPQDVTTNPVLVFQAAQKPEYADHIKGAIQYAKTHFHNFDNAHKDIGQPQENASFNFNNLSPADKKRFLLCVYEKLGVSFGVEILKIIPGWISTQLDPRLAYDQETMLISARRMVKHYETAGVSRDRFMIKVPTTWEGIQVARQLESEGIHVNMTLMFSFAQAIASADAGATMISPYVARLQDWFVVNQNNNKQYELHEHPGLLKVAEVWRYFKHFGLKTAILVANCRKGDEVLQLSGCDRHTIGPAVLDELRNRKNTHIPRKCSVDPNLNISKIEVPDEKTFRWMLNEDAAAYEKLGDGLRKFAAEVNKLDQFIIDRL